MSSEFNHEALELLIDTARQGNSADKNLSVVDVPFSNEFAIVDGFAKTATIKAKSPPQRAHRLMSVHDIVAFSTLHAIGDTPIIWIGDASIVVALDSDLSRVRGDHAKYSWKITPEFELLTKLSKMSPDSAFQQAALLKLIRTTLWNNFMFTDQRDMLVTALRSVVAQQGTQLTQGKGTYEASLMSNAGAAITWPERLSLQVKVFEDPSLVTLQPVDCVFDVDATSKTFSIWPTVASLNAAVVSVREQASELIRDAVNDAATTISVFSGSPQ